MIDLIDENAIYSHYGKHFNFIPSQWQTYTDVHNWQIQKLEQSKKTLIPTDPGIYTLILQPGIANHPNCSYLMYLGETDSLQTRFVDYLGKERQVYGRPLLFTFLNKYDEYIWFCYTADIIGNLVDMENKLNMAYLPPLNSKFPTEISSIQKVLW